MRETYDFDTKAKNKGLDAILQPFCGNKEQSRFAIHTPFISGEWTAATCGHVMAAVRKDVFSLDDYPSAGVPNVSAIFADRSHWYNMPRSVDIATLKLASVEQRIPAIVGNPPKMPAEVLVKCKDCRGNKKCSCRCNGEHYCRTCNGKGEVRSEKTKAAIEAYRQANNRYHDRIQSLKQNYVWLLGVPLKYEYVCKMAVAAEAMGEKTLNFLAAGDSNKTVIAEAGCMRFAIMPLRVGKDACTIILED